MIIRVGADIFVFFDIFQNAKNHNDKVQRHKVMCYSELHDLTYFSWLN